jgi:adenosine deaminase
VKVTLNSDNWLVTGHKPLESSIINEIRICVQELGFTIDQIKRIIRNSLEGRFAEIEQQWVE